MVFGREPFAHFLPHFKHAACLLHVFQFCFLLFSEQYNIFEIRNTYEINLYTEGRGNSTMELWDIYDKCFVKTGRTHVRGTPLNKGDYHLVVHIYPINSKGQILIQKRTKAVSWKPGYWAATGGSAISGDDAWTTCRKELMEELGIEATRENASLVLMYRRHDSFCAVWIVITDVGIEELKLQPDEVETAKWVTREELKSMAEKGLMVNYFYLDFLLGMLEEEYGTVWNQKASN